jgi:hypothetical protein
LTPQTLQSPQSSTAPNPSKLSSGALLHALVDTEQGWASAKIILGSSFCDANGVIIKARIISVMKNNFLFNLFATETISLPLTILEKGYLKGFCLSAIVLKRKNLRATPKHTQTQTQQTTQTTDKPQTDNRNHKKILHEHTNTQTSIHSHNLILNVDDEKEINNPKMEKRKTQQKRKKQRSKQKTTKNKKNKKKNKK